MPPIERKKLQLIAQMRNWYAKFERPISSLSLVGGFVFDAITLKRVDTLWENIWVFGHLLIVAICIILINREEDEISHAKNPEKLHFWLVNIMQFFFGGLLSTYLVFYFRSGALSVSWPFLLILAIAFVANESLKRHFARLAFQISFLFLSIFSFAIFLVPVVLHRIGPEVFVLSGLVSLGFLWIFLKALQFFAGERFDRSRKTLFFSISGIFIVMNALYFGNFIPPIPLSVKDAGVYHSVTRNTDGNYTVKYEVNKWWNFLQFSPDFHANANDPIYVYSAIFSPSLFNMNIIHEWQKYNYGAKKWETSDKVNLTIIGGRDGGYRTYSSEIGLAYGKWRVNVETPTGQLIDRIRFNVVPYVDNIEYKSEIRK